MEYTEDMILVSDSGYCMPFQEDADKEVEVLLGYGEQAHPKTGELFQHHGIDFAAHHKPLLALATGTVSSVGSDAVHGVCQTIQYGNYEVTYGHLANVYAQFGQTVRAGQAVSLSGDFLHFEVKVQGQELDPMEFIGMMYGNVRAQESIAKRGTADLATFESTIPGKYDGQKDEIEPLLLRFFVPYLRDIFKGNYQMPMSTVQSMRNVFSLAAAKNYFFQTLPSMVNPMGITQDSESLVVKMQNLIVGDFLNYMAMMHATELGGLSELLKKK